MMELKSRQTKIHGRSSVVISLRVLDCAPVKVIMIHKLSKTQGSQAQKAGNFCRVECIIEYFFWGIPPPCFSVQSSFYIYFVQQTTMRLRLLPLALCLVLLLGALAADAIRPAKSRHTLRRAVNRAQGESKPQLGSEAFFLQYDANGDAELDAAEVAVMYASTIHSLDLPADMQSEELLKAVMRRRCGEEDHWSRTCANFKPP